jgi:hypothetical protein
MLTILLFIPLVEQLCEVIVTSLEYVKGLVSKPVLKVNKELLDLQAQQEEISTQAMGFVYNGDDEYDYIEDDDFEDKKKSKIKMGFHR